MPVAVLLSLLILGCGGNSYTDDFSDRFCTEWKACTGEPCEFEDSDSGSCSYDEEAAAACIDDEWICDDAISGEEELLLPSTCYEIYYDCEPQ